MEDLSLECYCSPANFLSIYASSLRSHGEQGCLASQDMKLSCLACSNTSQETGPQCNVLNYISIPRSPSSTLSLHLETHHYCRNSHHRPNVQKQRLLFYLFIGGFFLKQNAKDKINKSISKAFKWMCSHYNWYQDKGMQTGQSVAWCL